MVKTSYPFIIDKVNSRCYLIKSQNLTNLAIAEFHDSEFYLNMLESCSGVSSSYLKDLIKILDYLNRPIEESYKKYIEEKT